MLWTLSARTLCMRQLLTCLPRATHLSMQCSASYCVTRNPVLDSDTAEAATVHSINTRTNREFKKSSLRLVTPTSGYRT